MWALMLSLGIHTAAGSCEFDPGSATDPIAAHAPAAGTVIFEFRLAGRAPFPTALLKVLTDRDLPATLLVTSAWAPQHSEQLAGLSRDGHEVGYWVSIQEDLRLDRDMSAPPSLTHWVRGIRQGRRAVRQATKVPVRAIGIATLPNIAELAIEGLGFGVVLPAERTMADVPRRIGSLTSSAGRARIIGEGPYNDGCGAVLPAWTPGALDRATGAAARARWVRIALPSSPAAAPLLARWLDDVVLAQEWKVQTAGAAARDMRNPLKSPPKGPTSDPSAVPVSRSIHTETWTEVAQALAQADTLPRQLPGDLSPTEAFLGLTQILAGDTPPSAVVLTGLKPPVEVARTGLGTVRVPLSDAAVRHAARELLPGLKGHVPSLVSVGTQMLTAAEFLRVMALVHLSQPPEARGVADPDPFAPGGGWGESAGL